MRETIRPRESFLTVERTARIWTLDEEEQAQELWYVLHGYRQLARRFLRRFTAIHDGRRRIVAPEALSRFYLEGGQQRHGPTSVVGATWMTREDRLHEIDDYVAYLDRLHQQTVAEVGASVPVTLLGFSQGVATAARWVVQGAVRPARLLVWGDTLPPDLDPADAAARLGALELVRVRGDDDPAVGKERSAAEEEALAAMGVESRIVRYPGGHEIHEATLRGLAR